MSENLRDLFLLDQRVTFLNHGSFGACPRPVFERYVEWARELECQPVEFLGRRYWALMAEARAALGAYLGTSGDHLVFVPNATHGVNIVARSLSLAPGDEVLGTNHEYGACEKAWRFVCRDRGALYRTVDLPLPVTTADALVERVWSQVTERTKVLFISHITSPTALTVPIQPLIRRAKEQGILTVIDGAHAPGQIPLHLDELGADLYTGNCHKWLCAPKGAAFLYASPAVQPLIRPLVVSWGFEPDEYWPPSPNRFVSELDFSGTRDIAAYLTVPAAIQFQADHDWPAVRERCHALLQQLRAGLLSLPGISPIHPDDPSWYAQMEAVLLPAGSDPVEIKNRLYDEFTVEIPTVPWNGQVLLRASIQGYNDETDVARLLAAVGEILGYLNPRNRTHEDSIALTA